MNNDDTTQDRWVTTEQIATAGNAPDQEDTPDQEYAPDPEDAQMPTGHPGREDDLGVPLAADHTVSGQADRTAPGTGNGASAAADPAAHARLLEDGELQSLTARWKDIQAEFVEEPTTAVRQADALVAELMQRLAVMFATERAELEDRWAGGNEVSTEDLRQGLRRYRSFFERLLAA